MTGSYPGKVADQNGIASQLRKIVDIQIERHFQRLTYRITRYKLFSRNTLEQSAILSCIILSSTRGILLVPSVDMLLRF